MREQEYKETRKGREDKETVQILFYLQQEQDDPEPPSVAKL